ncbi:MAG: DUF3793 family protein, partial [Bacillota bacterium]|nr:DUF3793 family protein [Bacillota bacterium]
SQLRQRLSNREDFPHEIGLFLGYPPEDVKGFIDDKESDLGKACGACRNCKSVGYWKVYHNPEEAEKIFNRYRKCTRVYHKHWLNGKPVESLTIKTS